MSFGSPAPRSVPTTTIQQNTLPEWVKREGENVFMDRALPQADRPFPGFPVEERIQPFGFDTQSAFNLARRETGAPTPGRPPGFQAMSRAPTAGIPGGGRRRIDFDPSDDEQFKHTFGGRVTLTPRGGGGGSYVTQRDFGGGETGQPFLPAGSSNVDVDRILGNKAGDRSQELRQSLADLFPRRRIDTVGEPGHRGFESFGNIPGAQDQRAPGVSGHNIPGGGANPEWTRINALLQATNQDITTRGVDNSADISALQSQLPALQQSIKDQLSNLTEEGKPGSADPRIQRQISDLTGQISTLQGANTPDTTGVNPEYTALQNQLAGINQFLPGQQLPGTPGTPATPGGPPAWADAFNSAMAGTAAGAVPVGQSDIERYFNPFTQQVIDPVVNQINRQFTRDTSQRHGNLARRGSYLNEDRRGAMDILAGEAKDRTIAETTARLRMGAFGDALQQGNVERNRTLASAAQFGQLAPERQQLGIRDIATLTGIGGMQEAKGQENRTLNFEEFMREFSYPQNQTGFLTSVLSGIPYETGRTTTGQTLIGQVNPFTQALGLGISAASLFASHRSFKENGRPVDPDMVLEAFTNLGVEKWSYKPEMRLGEGEHIGPYAEDFQRLFGVGDGVRIDPVDAIGVLCAAVKALTARVKELEDG